MVSSAMLRRVALVRTDVSEEPSASFIRVTKIGELGTTQAATSNPRKLRRNTKSVLTGATRRNIPEDTTLYTYFGFIIPQSVLYFGISGTKFRRQVAVAQSV
jgi:hypothetical protein